MLYYTGCRFSGFQNIYFCDFTITVLQSHTYQKQRNRHDSMTKDHFTQTPLRPNPLWSSLLPLSPLPPPLQVSDRRGARSVRPRSYPLSSCGRTRRRTGPRVGRTSAVCAAGPSRLRGDVTLTCSLLTQTNDPSSAA